MSRKVLINILENVFQPSVNKAMKEDLMGKTVKAISLAAETTKDLDFAEYPSISLTLGTQNITALNAVTTGLIEGEEVFLVITNDATPRTLAWGTGFAFAGGTGPTITAGAAAVDVFRGVVVGGDIVLMVLAQNIS